MPPTFSPPTGELATPVIAVVVAAAVVLTDNWW